MKMLIKFNIVCVKLHENVLKLCVILHHVKSKTI